MNLTTFFFYVTLNLVMNEENGVKVRVPAQIQYAIEYPVLYLRMVDTTEVYVVEQVNYHKGAVIMRLSGIDCKGFIRIVTHNEHSHMGRRVLGHIWFYKVCDHELIDRRFTIDNDRCFALVKRIQKQRRKLNTTKGEIP